MTTTRIFTMILALVSLSVHAVGEGQDTTGLGEAEQPEDVLEEVLVTGTQIKGAKVTGMLSVTSFDQEQIETLNATTTSEIYGYIPEAMSEVEFGDEANTSAGFLNAARGDLSALNLRHLGPDNSLQLINGRRLVRHPGSQFSGGVPIAPVNTSAIPARGVKRVEILRDGGAAIYGADAVAGVANTILRSNYEGFWGEVIYGESEGTSLKSGTLNLFGGHDFNQGRTNVALSLHYTDRDGFLASDNPRSAASDLRPFYVGTPFEGDTELDNRGTFSSWGQFYTTNPANGYARIRVRDIYGTTITASNGDFHIQPDTYQGGFVACRGDSENDTNPDVCIDDGARHRDHYYNRNPERTVQNDVERFNSYLFVNHEFENGMELFAEAQIYWADSHRQAEQAFLVASGPITISQEAYWNPFGERLSGNPNRLPDANVPDEGYTVEMFAYRPTDLGPQTADIENTTYRGVLGLRGDFKGWDWETGLVYSDASTKDIAHNWLTSSGFMAAINRTDELAYNPFNGGCADAPTESDYCTPGTTEATLDQMRTDIYRKNYTDLSLIDFKISNPSALPFWGGREVGIATGVEWRNEGWYENRDPRLDGTITYTNEVNPTRNGPGTGDTDVFGLSSTPDGKGDTDVYSAFIEFSIPITENLKLQYAGRYEDHEQVGDIYVNKLAGSWFIGGSKRFMLRGSYAEGFKSPSAATLFTPPVVRNGSGTDNYRCYAYGELGTDAEVQALWDSGAITYEDTYRLALAQNDVTCDDGQGDFPSPRLGGPELNPETSEQISVGFVWSPVDNLLLTVDYWEIEQFDVFNRVTNDQSLQLDFALRLEEGSTYDAVVRLDPDGEDDELYALAGLPVAGRVQRVDNFYTNLDSRLTRGLDYHLAYDLPTTKGDFWLKLSAFKLLERLTTPAAILEPVFQLGFPDLLAENAVDTVRKDGRPQWRLAATLGWSKGTWRVSTATRCVSNYTDTSVSNGEIFLNVPGGCSTNLYVRKRFNDGWLENGAISVGVRNVLEKEPAKNDSDFGVSQLYASLEGRYWYVSMEKRFR